PPPLSTLFPYTTLFRSSFQPSAFSGFSLAASWSLKADSFFKTFQEAGQGRSSCCPSSAWFGRRPSSPLRCRQRPSCLAASRRRRSEEHTSELQSRRDLV